MTYALSAQVNLQLSLREEIDSDSAPLSEAGGNQRSYTQPKLVLSLNADSEPPIAGEVVDLSWTLSGSTKDFDLTAAPTARDPSETVDKSTKKLVGIILQFDPGNAAGGVTFGPQGGNGYALFGASKTAIFYPGTTIAMVLTDPDQETFTLNTPAVGGSSKDLRFAGTAADTWKAKLFFNG
jgi:hypothetical protein